MSPLDSRPDRRVGGVLIVVFLLGFVGASLAAIINGGTPPEPQRATLQLARPAAPL